MALVNFYNDHHIMVTLKYVVVICLGGNQQLASCVSDQLYKRKIIHGTRNLVSYMVPVELWILEKNTQPSLC